MDNFRESVNIALRENSITKSQLAVKIGVAPSYVYEVLKRKKRLNEDLEKKIMDVLGIQVCYTVSKLK